MNDQCKHCTVQGDMPACINTPCSQHASWFAKAKSAELSRAYALIEEMRDALEFERDSHNQMGHGHHTEWLGAVITKADTFLAERVK